jgi:hypothetical protein
MVVWERFGEWGGVEPSSGFAYLQGVLCTYVCTGRQPGLPDGTTSYQKIPIFKFFCRPWGGKFCYLLWAFGVFYKHLVYILHGYLVYYLHGYLVYYMVIWYTLCSFGKFFVVIWHIFSILVYCTKTNLATLVPTSSSRMASSIVC